MKRFWVGASIAFIVVLVLAFVYSWLSEQSCLRTTGQGWCADIYIVFIVGGIPLALIVAIFVGICAAVLGRPEVGAAPPTGRTR